MPFNREPLVGKVASYMSTISLDEYNENVMNQALSDDQTDDDIKEIFLRRNTEVEIQYPQDNTG